MQIPIHPKVLVWGALGLLIALLPSPALAAVSTLRQGLLRASDLPPGFKIVKVQAYLRYPHFMELNLPQAVFQCIYTSGSVQRDGWRASLLEAILRPGPNDEITLCGWRFATAPGARAAYQEIVNSSGLNATFRKGEKRLPTGGIGDESLGGAPPPAPPSDKRPQFYEIFLRRSNAVFLLTYEGARKDVPPARFVQLAKASDSRLR